MRGIETFTLIGVVGLLGLAIWQGSKWLPGNPLVHPGLASVATPPLGKATTVSPKDGKKVSLKRGGRASSLSARAGGSVAENSTEPITVLVPIPAAPAIGNFSIGVTRAQVREQYGEPSLNVVSREDGQLVERYYYQTDPAHFIVATLRDGRVVHANTSTTVR